ncbi:MAG: GNAT family N-acetyltransferase [Bacteroidia bacterium]|nr:GNAT family N-acetyltransferase [Bacteroidia bacterium]
MNVVIRNGFKEDLPAVLSLIKELAEYEKEPHEVVVSLQEMEHDGFGENPVFRFFVAEADGRIIGMALYFVKYSTWKGKCVYLDDIIITQSYRRKGIGKLLFEAVVKATKNLRARRLEWQVLDWNKPAIAFYKNYDARFMQEWLSCRLTEEELKKINTEVSVR